MPSPPVVLRRTIKQAKADFKSRNNSTLTPLQQKQLQRSVQLDQRAWGLKQSEKRRAEAAKRRQEKLRLEAEERQRQALLGSQRRCDRFGYQSSQLHLGAFFGGKRVKREFNPESCEGGGEAKVDEEEDIFGDDGVDDETLLDALASPKVLKSVQHPQSDSASSVPPRPVATLQRSKTEPMQSAVDDLDDFWDELGSSTQIARELSSDAPAKPPPAGPTTAAIPSRTTTWAGRPGALKERHVNLPSPSRSAAERDRKMIPPPRLPSRHIQPPPPLKQSPSAEKDRKAMPPPMLPASSRSTSYPLPAASLRNVGPARAIAPRSTLHQLRPPPKPVVAAKTIAHIGFTASELESFVDDDLQLTQVVPSIAHMHFGFGVKELESFVEDDLQLTQIVPG